MTARVIAFSRADAATLDGVTTPAGLSWAMFIDMTNGRLRIFDGVAVGGIELARRDEVTLADAPYRLEAPTTGATIALGASDRILILNPAAAIAALTVTMAAGVDKRQVRIASRQRIDALTINGFGGDSVDWAVNEMPAQGAITLQFVDSISTWVRIA